MVVGRAGFTEAFVSIVNFIAGIQTASATQADVNGDGEVICLPMKLK